MDWSTAASLATASGTLVLAIATFASTRTANRATRLAEESLLAGLRPLLLNTRFDDPPEKIMWADDHFTRVQGGRGAVEQQDGVMYLAAAVRNAGAGLAVMHGWRLEPNWQDQSNATDTELFRRLTRDIYIAPGDSGFWQGAIREAEDPDQEVVRKLVANRERFAVDCSTAIKRADSGRSRASSSSRGDAWLCSASRHWYLDRPDPR